MPTISDVARAAGVSPMTVSRVLNHSGGVTKKKQDAVLRAVEALNYHPNLVARSLATNRSDTVGLLVTQVSNSIYAAYIDGIVARLRHNRLDVILYAADSYAAARLGLAALLSKQVDGVVLLPLELPDYAGPSFAHFLDFYAKVRTEAGRPVLSIGNVFLDGCPHVLEDYAAGARLAVEHLAGLGHRDIGYLRGAKDNYPWAERTAGFEEAAERLGLRADAAWRPASAAGFDAARDAMGQWLDAMKGRPMPTALYCANDLMALGAMSALGERGIRVPEDLSLVGHDGSAYSACCHPKMTTVAIGARRTGELAADWMARWLDGDEPPGDTMIAPSLIEGRTARPPR